jgi:hypothetical protein
VVVAVHGLLHERLRDSHAVQLHELCVRSRSSSPMRTGPLLGRPTWVLDKPVVVDGELVRVAPMLAVHHDVLRHAHAVLHQDLPRNQTPNPRKAEQTSLALELPS